MPITGEGGKPAKRTGKAKRYQMSMKLRQCSPLLARIAGLGFQPACQSVGKPIGAARSFAVVNAGSAVPDRRSFEIVSCEVPARRLILRINCIFRNAIRQWTIKGPKWITP
jgi:isopentenyl diphosphate isomerase/L-lactate dehydrogenase-like FMN-dependent dehydrogenase